MEGVSFLWVPRVLPSLRIVVKHGLAVGASGVSFPEAVTVIIFEQPPIFCLGECVCVYVGTKVRKTFRASTGNGKGLCVHSKVTEKDSRESLKPHLKHGEVSADLN